MTSDRFEGISERIRSGALLGPYQLTGALGEGGMGVVVAAIDTKLQRPVAIKFLSSQFANADARRRFQREAQLASSLNHPHILTVHDVGEFEGNQYIVTELVDGGTLTEWAATDRRTWQQIVDLLVGVADGLATAHQAGILHRDVKPHNVLVAKNGYAKLADFGLAKLSVDAPPGASAAETETLTQHGVILGTVAYMSPEQATGKELDARSDIFSFGVVLYELVAGRRPFTGATAIDVLQAIINGTAPPLDSTIPLPLRMIVEKSLERDPADRYQTMRDLVVDLRRVARRRREDSGEATAPGVTPSPSRPRRWAIGAAVVAVSVLAGALADRWWDTAPPAVASPSEVRFQQITDFEGMEDMPAVSPDGKLVAFVFPVDGRRQIWLRQLASGGAFQRTFDDVDHEHPRWLPDSSAIVYFTPSSTKGEPGTLMEISALAGSPRQLATSTTGADVSPDGRQIATFQTAGARTVLAIVQRDGTSAGRTVPVEANGVDFSTPRWSPDGGSVAFVANEETFSFVLYVIDVAGGRPQKVAGASDIKGIAWLPDGSGLVYASSLGSTLAYPPIFNLRLVGRTGGPERQLTVGDVSYVHPDVGPAGQLFASRVSMQSDIYEFPVSGSASDNVSNARQITRQTAQVRTPSVSPRGDEIAYLSDSGGHANIWVARIDGSASPRQITTEHDPAVVVGLPIWSPAGDRIVYISSRAAVSTEWLVNPDGSDRQELVEGRGAVWSADGRWLYYVVPPNCIYRVPVPRNGAAAETILCDAANLAVSADGKTVYFSPTAMSFNIILKTSLPDGTSTAFARYAPTRLPYWPTGHVLSPNDLWIALPLKDGDTTNIWAIPTDRGPFPPFRQITNFGRRPVLIARRVSWSKNSKFIYAAVVESDADIVLLEGMVGDRIASRAR